MSAPYSPFAFPFPDQRDADGCGIMEGSNGMILREYFAGQALAGLLAGKTYSNSGDGFEAFIATESFNIADAMMEESSK